MGSALKLKTMRKYTRHSDIENGQAGWLTTFNDMITLLMVFFVLLFTMGSIDVKRVKHFQNSLQSALGVLNPGSHAPVGITTDDPASSSSPENGQTGEQKRPDHDEVALRDLDRQMNLGARFSSRGVQLTLDNGLLFRSGEARITDDGKKALAAIGAILKQSRRTIRIEGHTDNVPIATQRFPSNWELSTARAVQVVRFFAEQVGLSPSRLSAAGYGAVKPKMPNDSSLHRAMNRRVEIVLGRVENDG